MKSLVIKNYKNFEHLTIDNLADVNLIAGKNNVGKSSLLEAISIVASNGDINWIRQLLEMRGETIEYLDGSDSVIDLSIEWYSSLYHNRDEKQFYKSPIELTTNNSSDAIALTLVAYSDNKETSKDGSEIKKREVLNESQRDEHLYDDGTEIGLSIKTSNKDTISKLPTKNRVLGFSKLFNFDYVRTNEITSTKNAELFDKLALTENEKYIIEALQIIEPQINKLNFVKLSSYSRIPIVVLKDSDKRYRLSSMGDGINHILTIILALLNCKNGIILIDEFENGLHHSVQSKVWEIIFKLSKELNIQVFATTHSDDTISCFAEQNKENRGRYIRLENKKEQIVAINYSDNDKLAFALNQDMELR